MPESEHQIQILPKNCENKDKGKRREKAAAEREPPLLLHIPSRPKLPATSSNHPVDTTTPIPPSLPNEKASVPTARGSNKSKKRKRSDELEASARPVRPRLEESEASALSPPPIAPPRPSGNPRVPGFEIPEGRSVEAAMNAMMRQLFESGIQVDRETFLGKLLSKARTTQTSLANQTATAAQYYGESVVLRRELQASGSRIAVMEAEVEAERARADALQCKVKALEGSSSKISAEFRKAILRVKELEAQLMGHRITGTLPSVASSLQKMNEDLKKSVATTQLELKHSTIVFNTLQKDHQALLHRHANISEANRLSILRTAELEGKVADMSKELGVARRLVMKTMNPGSEAWMQDMESDRDRLTRECRMALEYAAMLRQLDLPSFVWAFQQKISEPLYRLHNLLRSPLSVTTESPLLREAARTLTSAIPMVSNTALHTQLALRTVLEDFDLQFPDVRALLRREPSLRVSSDLFTNAGYKVAPDGAATVFDANLVPQNEAALGTGFALFPLETVRGTTSPSLSAAIRTLLAELDINIHPSVPATPVRSPRYSPLSPSVLSPVGGPSNFSSISGSLNQGKSAEAGVPILAGIDEEFGGEDGPIPREVLAVDLVPGETDADEDEVSESIVPASSFVPNFKNPLFLPDVSASPVVLEL